MNVNEQIAKQKGMDTKHGSLVWHEDYLSRGWECLRCHTSEFALDKKPCTPDWEHDIAAAWQLVEEAENDPQQTLFSIVRKGTETSYLAWFARFRNCWGNQHDYWAEADTAPEAISLAWLKWKGAK